IWKQLLIHTFGTADRTFLIALNKKTGDEVWRAPIPGAFGKTQPDWMGSWSTPVIAHIGNRDELIMSWPNAVKAYNPRTGKELWTCDGMGKLSYTSPLVSGDTVVAMSGFGGPYLAVKAGGSGDVTATNRLWRVDHAPQRIGSGVIIGEHIYHVNENGVAVCIELKTGKTLWEERATSSTWGSLVMADGRLYVTS